MIERNLEEKRSILTSAKNGFNKAMISHDLIGDSLLSFLAGQALPEGLPDFVCEPYVKHSEDGHVEWGFRLTHGVTDTIGEVSSSFRAFSHLPMVNVDLGTREAKLTNEFKATLPEDTSREHKIDALQFFQTSMAQIGRQLPGEVDIDPFTHTIELVADIGNTHTVAE